MPPRKDLLPHFEASVESILDVYKAYRTDAHDIQGIRDDGVDILVRYEYDGASHRIGFQLKSNDEFEAWPKKKLNMIEKLKSQYSAARENAKVDDYYILLCADDGAHRRKVRMICSELKNYRGCTIVEPRDALGFWELSELDILARTTRLLCNTDVILQMALSAADGEEPPVAFFLVSLVCHAFEHGIQIDKTVLFNLWLEWEELLDADASVEERLSEVILDLSESGSIEDQGSMYAIDVTRLPAPLCALYFDLRVRNIASKASTRDYMVRLLELKDRAHSESDDYDMYDEDEELED